MTAPTIVSSHLQRAHQLIKNKNLTAAVRELETGLQATPQDPEMHFALGYCYDAQGQKQRAISCYESTLRIKHNHTEALRYMGLALIEMGNTPQGIKALNTVFKQLRDQASINILSTERFEARRQQLDDFETTIAHLEKQRFALEKDTTSLTNARDQILSIFNELNIKTEALDKELKSKSSIKERLEQESKHIAAQVEEAKRRLAEENNRLKSLSQQTSNLEKEVKSLTKQHDDISVKIQTLKIAKISLDKQIEEAKTEFASLQAQKKELERNKVDLQQDSKQQPQQTRAQSNDRKGLDLPDWFGPV